MRSSNIDHEDILFEKRVHKLEQNIQIVIVALTCAFIIIGIQQAGVIGVILALLVSVSLYLASKMAGLFVVIEKGISNSNTQHLKYLYACIMAGVIFLAIFYEDKFVILTLCALVAVFYFVLRFVLSRMDNK